jgi:hypothetical protein
VRRKNSRRAILIGGSLSSMRAIVLIDECASRSAERSPDNFILRTENGVVGESRDPEKREAKMFRRGAFHRRQHPIEFLREKKVVQSNDFS